MSIQWTFIAGYLYFEIGVVILLMLPIAGPRRWRQFFKSRLFVIFQQHAAVYFYIFQCVLVLFLTDSIREMRKYAHSTDGTHVHLASEMKDNVKLFRAQRNFYITGFAIFLSFVMKRLITIILIQAELLDKSEWIIKEAESAKEQAKNTVLAHTIQRIDEQNFADLKKQLELIETQLTNEKLRAVELEKEAREWKTKFEELEASLSGKGDE